MFENILKLILILNLVLCYCYCWGFYFFRCVDFVCMSVCQCVCVLPYACLEPGQVRGWHQILWD